MNKVVFCSLLATLHIAAALPGVAAELVLQSKAIERDGPFQLLFRTGLQATGKGTLALKWTDSYGRDVETLSLPVVLSDESEFTFSLDGRRAVAMENQIQAHFSFDGKNKKSEADHREQDVSLSFIASPPDRSWWDYMIIMWQNNSANGFSKLKELGINGGQFGDGNKSLPGSPLQFPGFLIKNSLRWYAENIATDFYSAYHIYRPDRPYNYALLEAKQLYKQDPASKDALKRHPSLSDPAWLDRISERVARVVKEYSPFRPIFYNLADEAGIAELAGFWDFDFSDHSLDAMRGWLKARYGTLEALNRQWSTSFSEWDLVTPNTTREVMQRTDANYSSWADHKEWMDKSFADALKVGVDAAHSVDPRAYVALEGAQMPGWGGYDYWRLSNVLQAMEPYDIGDNIEIVRSFNPAMAFLTTAFAQGPWERHRLWYELLHGARGHIIWDEKYEIVGKDGKVGQRGREVAPYYAELRDGTGALLINSTRQADPIAIHYSQASLRTQWVLARKRGGTGWEDRMSWTERQDSDFLRLRDSYCRLVEDQGLQYNFVSYNQVEDGELAKRGYRLLILPGSDSLSAQEARQILAFVQTGGVLIVDGEAGTYDEHSRRLDKSSLADILDGNAGLGKVIQLNAIEYHRQRVVGTETPLHDRMRRITAEAGLRPLYSVVDASGNPVTGVETHTFVNGGVTIVGLLSNPQISIDELGPPEFKSNRRFERPQSVLLHLPTDLFAYDIRNAKALGRIRELPVTVDPYEPSLFAFSATAFPALAISAPKYVERGENVYLGLSMSGHTAAQTHLFHVDVHDGAGKLLPFYSGNVLAPQGQALKLLPLARNDSAGEWKVKVHDLLSGQRQVAVFHVH